VKDRVDDLIAACTEKYFSNLHSLTPFIPLSLDTFFPPDPSPQSLLHSETSGSLLNARGFDRQYDLLEKAQSAGQVIYRGETNKERLRMGISLVKMSESDTGGLVEDEIFGPVMPIIPVEVGCGDGKRADK